MSSQREPDCLFCKIIEGQIPGDIVKKTDRITAFRDISPQAPTHILVIPNTHVASVSETSEDQVFSDVLGAARDIAREQNLSDYRLVVNNGAGAGQSVFHLHFHLLAGRPFSWPPG